MTNCNHDDQPRKLVVAAPALGGLGAGISRLRLSS
jgi:hypothetical protein